MKTISRTIKTIEVTVKDLEGRTFVYKFIEGTTKAAMYRDFDSAHGRGKYLIVDEKTNERLYTLPVAKFIEAAEADENQGVEG